MLRIVNKLHLSTPKHTVTLLHSFAGAFGLLAPGLQSGHEVSEAKKQHQQAHPLNRAEGMSVLAAEDAEHGMVVPKMVDKVRPGTLATHGLHLPGCFSVTLPGLLLRIRVGNPVSLQ